MTVISLYKPLLLLTIINLIKSQHVVFDYNENQHGRSREAVEPRILRTSRLTPTTIDNIFQIPVTVIQGTSAAAQSWSPGNRDTIDKAFNIPIQTLQAIGNLVKDQIPTQYTNRDQNRLPQRTQRYQDPTNEQRFIHHGGLTWASTWSNLFFGNHGNFFSPSPHRMKKKKKKKKKKKPIHNNNCYANLGSRKFHHHGGSHLGNDCINHDPQEILGGDGNVYQVTEDIDDITPLANWKPIRYSDYIQNKIAPRN